jgi:hypothetical protein
MVKPEITASKYPIFGKTLLRSCYIICIFGSSAKLLFTEFCIKGEISMATA